MNSRFFPRHLVSALGVSALFLALYARALSQDTVAQSPITFSGTSTIFGQTANHPGIGQLVPKDFVRWDLQSTLGVYGVPLSVNALVTSEQNGSDQTMNYFSIGLDQSQLQAKIRQRINDRLGDLQAVRDRIQTQGVSSVRDSLASLGKDKANLVEEVPQIGQLEELQNLKDSELSEKMEEVQRLGLASAAQSFTTLFPKLLLGNAFPSYTPLTMDGIPVTGVDVEFTPGIFYLAATGGKVSDGSGGYGLDRGMLLSTSSFKRTVLGGRAGIGRKDGSHFFLTALFLKDNEGSLSQDSLHSGLTPQANSVYGAEGALLLLDDRLAINGEVAASVITNDVTAPDDPAAEIPGWIKGLSSPNSTSGYDYAFSLQSKYSIEESGTNITGTVRRIGPGYSSLGVPYLRKDLLQYEGKVGQELLHHQISVGLSYRHDEDNLDGTKSGTTKLSSFGADLGLVFRGLPYLKIRYAPLSQQSQRVTDSLKIQNDITLLNILSGYVFRTDGGLVSATTVSFIHQEAKTLTGEGAYRSRNGMLSQSLAFVFPLTVSFDVGITETDIEASSSSVVISDFSVSHVAWGIWQNTLGFTLMRDAVQRTGVTIASAIPLWDFASLAVAFEHSVTDDPAFGLSDYDESIFRVTLSKSW